MNKLAPAILVMLVLAVMGVAGSIVMGIDDDETVNSIIVVDPTEKLQVCPDEFIDNQMPGPDQEESVRQYFILDGSRRELDEFDIAWVEKNCNLKKQVVY